MHSGLLVSKLLFQVEYSIIGQILQGNYTGFGCNKIAKVIDYQILADTLIIK